MGFAFVFNYVYAHDCLCRGSWRPEEGVRVLGAELTRGRELLDVGAGS